jgi:alditol oxidase
VTERSGPRANWAGNVVFGAERYHRPGSVAELQRLVAGSSKVRALGTGHSFSRLADTTGDLISVAGLPSAVEIDTARAAVTVGGGLRYSDITGPLHAAGLALRNLGSLPHISVAGACATGTHGSGVSNGNLATAVAGLDMVTADGDICKVRRDAAGGEFEGMVVALGALGVVISLTLDTVAAFDVAQYVYEDLPLEQVAEHFDEIVASAYSVSLFTDWRGPWIRQAWLKRRAEARDQQIPEPRWLGGRLADGPRHPIPGLPAGNCTVQQGIPGPWHERLPHFRAEFMPSAGAELQSEYLVPRERATEGLLALDRIAGRLAPLVQISEIRTIAADRLWLSPSYARDSVAFHFTWIDDPLAVAPALAVVEEALAPLRARPHWGKLFAVQPEILAGLYPRQADFLALMRNYDPAGKFRNDLLDRYFPDPAPW